jgi:regulator of replication initiation timing
MQDEISDLREIVQNTVRENEILRVKVLELEAKLRASDPTCASECCDSFEPMHCGAV